MKKTLAAFAAIALPLTALAHSPTPEPQGDNMVHSYVLLDRTGSMRPIWDEALSSVNAYAKGLADNSDGEILDTSITVAVFDAQEGLQFDVLRRNVGAGGWKDISDDEASPRGMTPLFDAIGQILSIAEKDKPEKAVIVIMTDGAENASREMTKDTTKAALDKAREKGWEVVFLGAEFATFSDAEAVGNASSRNMAVSAGAFDQTMERLSKKSRAYGADKAESVEFDAEDREVAKEEDVKERKGDGKR